MTVRNEFGEAQAQWELLTIYQKFEQAVIVVLTLLIALVVVLAVWNLILKVAGAMVAGVLDPTDYRVFQALFGMIMTVIIALEFKRSLLVFAERQRGIVQVRTVVLIALLAIVRKLLILDFSATDAEVLFGLAVTIVSLGAVYWIVRDQDRRDQARDDQVPAT